MKTDTRDLVSVTELSRNVSQYVSDADEGRTFIVLKNNRAAAAVVPISEMEKIDALAEREEDLRLWALATARALTDTGERFSLEDVAAELGIDLEELRDEPDTDED